MNWFTQLFTRRRRYEELSESIREHLEEKIADLMDRGMTWEEAERAARREFGNVTLIEERSREVWQWPTVESLVADARFALRQLSKSPGFTITAVLTLAVGIAVNGTIFSVVRAWLMPDLPERNADKVVVVSAINPNDNFLSDVHFVSAPTYASLHEDKQVFAETAATHYGLSGTLGSQRDRPESIQYAAVTPNYFNIFGATPLLGRGFFPDEDQFARNHVVVLSYGLWARRFGSDPGIVGRTIRLNREDYTVVGVMGANFRLMWLNPQLWTPLTFTAAELAADGRRSRNLVVFAHLAPTITLAQAGAEAKRLASRAATDYPDIESRWGASVRTLKDYLVRSSNVARPSAVMMTAVGFLLLIACANVSGLLLTRSAERHKELAIRASLGASRWRLVRQLLIEGFTIATIGGATGLALTWVGIRLMRSLLSYSETATAVPLNLDARVLGFAAVLTLLSALLSSAAPAWKASRTDINTGLKNDGRSATAGRGRNRMRAVLVGGEIAMALFLLVGAGLLIRPIYNLEHQQLGFRTDHLLTAGLMLDVKRYPDAATHQRLVKELLRGVHEIAGVESAAITLYLPSSGAEQVKLHIQGVADPPPSQPRMTEHGTVTLEFFATAGIAALRGRTFTEQDGADTSRVVVVNQRFVDRYLGGADAVGRLLKLEVNDGTPPVWERIIGVVSDIKSYSVETRVDPMVYEPFEQRPMAGMFSVILRGQAAPESMIPALRHAVAEVDPELPLLNVMSMQTAIEKQRNGGPATVEILGTFAGLALALAATGIYGLIAYSVRQRTQEFGIRLALGAKPSAISRMILGEGLKVTAIGSAIGLLLALPLGRLFDSMFPGNEFISPAVYPTVLALTIMIAIGATCVPARRAMKVDPSTALRSE